MSEQIHEFMFYRIKKFVEKTDSIQRKLKNETIKYIDQILTPGEVSASLDLLECLEFIKKVLEGGRYQTTEFVLVVEALDFLQFSIVKLKEKRSQEDGKEGRKKRGKSGKSRVGRRRGAAGVEAST